jgi:hypothetical protein
MPWYKAGTVSVTSNSNAVIGTGTEFLANSRVGDAFLGPDGGWYEITNIASNTSLSISPNYRSASNAAGAYALTPVQGYTKDLADQARAMIQQWGAIAAALGPVANMSVVPVANGGTGATSQGGARTALGLGTAAVAALGTAAGNAMPVGAFGLGATSAPVLATPAVVGFSVTSGGGADQTPSPGSGGSRITMNTGGLLFNELVIAANSATSPTLGYRQFNSNGVPGPWNIVYTNQNTTRAQDGTLKAI